MEEGESLPQLNTVKPVNVETIENKDTCTIQTLNCGPK